MAKMFLKRNVSGSFTALLPVQYGGLCCLFVPAVPVFQLAAVCPQSIDFLSTVHFCYIGVMNQLFLYYSDFFLNQRSDLGMVSNT